MKLPIRCLLQARVRVPLGAGSVFVFLLNQLLLEAVCLMRLSNNIRVGACDGNRKRQVADLWSMVCVAYSSLLRTVYLGAQNTSLQWCSDKKKTGRIQCSRTSSSASIRDDVFFDSKSVTGVRSHRPLDAEDLPKHAVGGSMYRIGRPSLIPPRASPISGSKFPLVRLGTSECR